MALIECKFYSKVLNGNTSMNVVIPTITFEDVMNNRKPAYASGDKFKTLYLLHGMSEDYSSWIRNTSIERYAQEKNIAVVMPNGGKSLYTDMVHGSRYWTFISEELPSIARSLFPLSDKREDNYVAGASMGGYGSYKLALLKPECYAAAASLSGSADISYLVSMAQQQQGIKTMLENVFGDLNHIIGSSNDLMLQLKNLKEGNQEIPNLFLSCGTEDMSLPLIKNFEAFTKQMNINITVEYSEGRHNWAFWDKSIRRVLDWLPL